MRIFLSHASEDRVLAEEVHLALRGPGHEVFFDGQSLPEAGDYNSRIRAAIQQSDCLVFLITPDSVKPGRYTRTELKYAQDRWPSPKGHVLSVMARATPWSDVPVYLKAVTVLEPAGNVAAETLDGVCKLGAALQLADDGAEATRPASRAWWTVDEGLKHTVLGAVLGAAVMAVLGVVMLALGESVPSDAGGGTILIDTRGDNGSYIGFFALLGGVTGGVIGRRGPLARPFVRLLAGAACGSGLVVAIAVKLIEPPVTWTFAIMSALVLGLPFGIVLGMLIAVLLATWRWMHPIDGAQRDNVA